jgi:hypothetical protein
MTDYGTIFAIANGVITAIVAVAMLYIKNIVNKTVEEAIIRDRKQLEKELQGYVTKLELEKELSNIRQSFITIEAMLSSIKGDISRISSCELKK